MFRRRGYRPRLCLSHLVKWLEVRHLRLVPLAGGGVRIGPLLDSALPHPSRWTVDLDEFKGAPGDEQTLQAAIGAENWGLVLKTMSGLAGNAGLAPVLGELASVVRLLEDGASTLALARLTLSPLQPFSCFEGPSLRILTVCATELAERELGEEATHEMLESAIFDEASAQRDAGWYMLSTWLASRRTDDAFDRSTIFEFGQSGLGLDPNNPKTHALWVRILLNLEDEEGAQRHAARTLQAHEKDDDWTWAFVQSAEVDRDFPELIEEAYARLESGFADQPKTLALIHAHRELLATDHHSTEGGGSFEQLLGEEAHRKLSGGSVLGLAAEIAGVGTIGEVAGALLDSLDEDPLRDAERHEKRGAQLAVNLALAATAGVIALVWWLLTQ